jgi:uroporphyrinogen-III synthase
VHYLIVRSADGLSETLVRFSVQAFQVRALSVMDIEYLTCDLSNINPDTGFVFTSVYGIKSLVRFFTPTTQTAFCVGETTAQQAKIAGFKNIIVPKIHNAKALSETILENNHYTKYVYCRGSHSKPYLEKTLCTHNFDLQIFELYKTIAIENLTDDTIHFLSNSDAIAMVCFSIRNAAILYDLIVKSGIAPHIIQQYHWHIVGNAADIDFVLKNKYFYDTPQKLYDYFGV